MPQQQPPQQLRSGKTGPRLLDDVALNVGASLQVPAPNFTATPAPGKSVRMLDLIAEDHCAQVVTLSVAASISSPGVITTALSGPIRCIVQWGSGSGLMELEFDVPSASQLPGLVAQQFRSALRSGASVSVSASSLRVFFINDACTLPCVAGGVCIGPSANIASVDPTIVGTVGYGLTHGAEGRLRRTIVISNNSSWQNDGAHPAFVGIPPFAKRVSILRDGLDGNVVSLSFGASSLNVGSPGPYVLGNNVDGPIDVPSYADLLLLTYTGTQINTATAVYELEV